ncbi:bifunctional DNA-formamidopyrimidine glycosylase/DNA-(apurinic or apyrimidinic site) lyase [uncultured Tolumonas sp.]|uniref:bifunctional DNA-formamidopyrimidine glycosylase/DNA-(apurinic or apyrimidinic site) lyase n=1 Tax=uncultured Tolumonas sp. TaxID=263765 RepID=UPI002A0A5312|nr:bifunctional DNA-formamidopyrimidine glycosylase/DNA-(apurinic or apyrimidinic site) lyase [uncultured Tolumonas sp.]
MPELPEVEVSRLGITPWMEGVVVEKVVIRHPRLRWPIPSEIHLLEGQPLHSIERRAKYLLLRSTLGTAIFHLGMSGHLRILPIGTPAEKHDHVDLELANGKLLRFHDPRRFGALLWTTDDPHQHPLLKNLGPEPLTDAFTADYLWQRSRKLRSAIKPWLMDNHVVVGVGNIYANESLFMAHIHPKRAVNSLTIEESQALVAAVKQVLARAITQGGTTLRDFMRIDGKSGYFVQELLVYGRAGQACQVCAHPLEELRLGQRSSVFCPICQPFAGGYD